MATQTNEEFYLLSIVAFFLIAIEGFGCLHQVDNFFHWYAKLAWLEKGIDGPPLVVLHTFYM